MRSRLVTAVAALTIAVLTSACEVVPLPEPPDSRTEVGPWVAFGQGEDDGAADSPEPQIADFLRARGIALRALADHAALGLTEPTDAALIRSLVRIDDAGGGAVFLVPGPDPIDAWVLTFRAPPPDGGAATEALVVVAADSGEVLQVHTESREAASIAPS